MIARKSHILGLQRITQFFLGLLPENPHGHKIPAFRGGGGIWAFLEGGGWKCQFYFYGRGDFSENRCPAAVNHAILVHSIWGRFGTVPGENRRMTQKEEGVSFASFSRAEPPVTGPNAWAQALFCFYDNLGDDGHDLHGLRQISLLKGKLWANFPRCVRANSPSEGLSSVPSEISFSFRLECL